MKRIALILLVLATNAAAQMPPALDTYIEEARKAWGVPGIAVTIVRDGKVLAAKGYGVRELGKPELVDENTVFDVASLSKSFTAAAIATLVDEGKMQWDDPVRRHLPAIEFPDPYRTANVTIRDLLAHRVGLEAGNFMFRFTNYDTAEVIRRMRFLEERQPFRTGMLYSNLGYAGAAEAAAHAAGMSFADLVRKRLVEPLGMSAASVAVEPDAAAANHATGHSIIAGVHQPIRFRKAMAILGANAVNASARDMGRWMLFHLGDGTWEGKRIVSQAAMREMHAPQIVVPTTPEFRAGRGLKYFAAYGLGWQVFDFQGRTMLWHSGSADGMPVYMAVLPDEQIGVCVMTNSWASGVLHGALASRILETLLGVEKPRDSAGEALEGNRRAEARAAEEQAALVKSRVPNTKPSRPLDAYAGTYEDRLHGDMVVRLEGKRLTLQFGGGDVADLEHWHYDTFRVVWRDRAYDWADTLAPFSLDAAGVPVRFMMRLNRDVIEATRK